MHRDDTAELIDSIYATAAEGQEWGGLLSTIADTTLSSWSLIIRTQLMTTRTSLVGGHGIDENAVSLYRDHFARISPLLQDVIMRIDREVYIDTMYPDRESYLNSEFYNDYLKPLDVPYLMQVFLSKQNGEAFTLLLRRGQGAGPYTEGDTSYFRLLSPHLMRAWSFRCSLEKSWAQSDLLGHLMNNVSLGILVVDEHLKPLAMNRRAQHILDEHKGLRIVHGRVMPVQPREAGKLEAAVKRAGYVFSSSSPLLEGLRIKNSHADIYITLTPLPETLKTRLQSPTAVALQVTDLSERSPPPIAALVEAFNLTRTEARIANALADGLTTGQIAEERTTTTQTIRWYIKKILGKLDAKKQSDIVKLITQIRHTLPDQFR